MLDIVLYEPEIPPNTGNIIRLAANTGMRLHLVKPFGFRLDAKSVERAGMDYAELTQVTQHLDWTSCRTALEGRRFLAITTRGSVRHDQIAYRENDVLVFGPETRGLPPAVLQEIPSAQRIRIPMCVGSRSLNLSNSAAVIAYEAWRQLGFNGGV
jgi:tRNA (cytidine/uridine-2'-O-)-methyltransferase